MDEAVDLHAYRLARARRLVGEAVLWYCTREVDYRPAPRPSCTLDDLLQAQRLVRASTTGIVIDDGLLVDAWRACGA